MAMDYQTFGSRKEAREQARKAMASGWEKAYATRLFLPVHGKVTDRGEQVHKDQWVVAYIEGNSDPKYLREDGYVR